MDFDVVPLTNENFFESWDLSKGIVIMEGLAPTQGSIHTSHDLRVRLKENRTMPSIRSPSAKWWNLRMMCMETGIPNDPCYVFNTGIVGASKEHLEQLDYFGEFDKIIELMDELNLNADGMYPDFFNGMFGWDNETIWGYKTKLNEVPWQLIGEEWHHFMDKDNIIHDDSKFVHVINKNFDWVRAQKHQ